MAALHLPDEIIETILLKLPMKSLFRFKRVSKSWNLMISDFRFIGTHCQLSMHSTDTDNLFLNYNSWDRRFSFVRFEGKNFNKSSLWRPHDWQTFLCIGDGLILLDRHERCPPNTYMLYNPCTRQNTILACPFYDIHVEEYNSNSWFDSWKMYGVCYDPVNKDIKIVIASKDFCTVYSSKNRSWAKKKEFPYQIASQKFDPGLSVAGAIYWRCYEIDKRGIIVCFDSKDDSFKILQKPDLDDDRLFYLKARKDRLFFCCYGRSVRIWIKDKCGCSWKVLLEIDNLYSGNFRRILIEALTENEMIICLSWKTYCIYNCCDKSYCEVNLNLAQSWLHPFVGSMLPPVIKRESRRKNKPSGA